jgi:hypothetical protein
MNDQQNCHNGRANLWGVSNTSNAQCEEVVFCMLTYSMQHLLRRLTKVWEKQWIRPCGLFQFRITFWNYEWFSTIGRLLGRGNQPNARPLLTQYNTTQNNKHNHPCRTRDSNLRSQRLSDQGLCLRPRGHWDQHLYSSQNTVTVIRRWTVRWDTQHIWEYEKYTKP